MARAAGTPCHAIMGTHTHTPTSLANNSQTLRVDPALRWRIIFVIGATVTIEQESASGTVCTETRVRVNEIRDPSSTLDSEETIHHIQWHILREKMGSIYIFLLLHQHVGCVSELKAGVTSARRASIFRPSISFCTWMYSS